MPTLTMDDEPGMDEPMNKTVQKEKHGRHKRYLLQNSFVNHPIPSLENERWIIPKDAMPSVNKKWYNKSNGSFCMNDSEISRVFRYYSLLSRCFCCRTLTSQIRVTRIRKVHSERDFHGHW